MIPIEGSSVERRLESTFHKITTPDNHHRVLKQHIQ